MVFNLTNQIAFKVIKAHEALICNKNYGPYFTAALYPEDEPFNEDNNCTSVYNFGIYESQLDADGFDRLINRKTEAPGQW